MSEVNTYWFIVVSGKDWDRKPRSWEEADRKRDEIKAYYPHAVVHLASLVVAKSSEAERLRRGEI